MKTLDRIAQKLAVSGNWGSLLTRRTFVKIGGGTALGATTSLVGNKFTQSAEATVCSSLIPPHGANQVRTVTADALNCRLYPSTGCTTIYTTFYCGDSIQVDGYTDSGQGIVNCHGGSADTRWYWVAYSGGWDGHCWVSRAYTSGRSGTCCGAALTEGEPVG